MIVGYFFRPGETAEVEFPSFEVAQTTLRRMRRHGWVGIIFGGR